MGAMATVLRVFDVNAVGGCVLRNDEQFLDARLHQFLGLAHHCMGGARGEAAAHVGNDAELALVIAALGNLEIAEMARRQGHAGRRQQIDKGIRRGRHGSVDCIQHLFVLMRASDGQNLGVMLANVIGLGPEAAGDDDLAVLGQSLTNRIQTFGLGAVKESRRC